MTRSVLARNDLRVVAWRSYNAVSLLRREGGSSISIKIALCVGIIHPLRYTY